MQNAVNQIPAQIKPASLPAYLQYFAANSTGSAANASGSESVAAGGNAVASGTNSVALGQGSVADTDNTVPIGNSATGLTRTLANVSASVALTDAVNVQQLNDSVSGVRSQIEHDRKDAKGGTASAIAIISLPQAPVPCYKGLAAITYVAPALFESLALGRRLRLERNRAHLRATRRANRQRKNDRKAAALAASLVEKFANISKRSKPNYPHEPIAAAREIELVRHASQLKVDHPDWDRDTCCWIAKQQLVPPGS